MKRVIATLLLLAPCVIAGSEAPRRTLASEHFRASFPAQRQTNEAEIRQALQVLESAYTKLSNSLSHAGLSFPVKKQTEVIIYATTGDFCGATGQPAWAGAVTRGNVMHTQPLAVLKKRGILDTTLRHEFIHVVLEQSGGNTPRWLAEGLAIIMAGESTRYARVRLTKQYTREQINEAFQQLTQPGSTITVPEARELYAASWREVNTLLASQGAAAVWRMAVK